MGEPVVLWSQLLSTNSLASFGEGFLHGTIDAEGNPVGAGTRQDPAAPYTNSLSYAASTNTYGNLRWTYDPGQDLGIAGISGAPDGSVILSTNIGLLTLSNSGLKTSTQTCTSVTDFGKTHAVDQTLYLQPSNTALMIASLEGVPNCSSSVSLSPPSNGSIDDFSVQSSSLMVASHYPVSTSCWSGDTGYLQSLDLTGNAIWSLDFNTFAAPQLILQARVVEVTEDSTPFIYVGGTWYNCNGHLQFVVLKINARGAVQWVKQWDDDTPETTTGEVGTANYFSAMIPDPKGGVILTGQITQKTPLYSDINNTDCGVVSYTSSGSVRWQQRLTFSKSDRCNDLAVSASGEYLYLFGSANSISGPSSLDPPTKMLLVKLILPQ